MGKREILLGLLGLFTGVALVLGWLTPRVTGWAPDVEFETAYTPIVIHFSQPINLESARERFSIQPDIAGELTTRGKELIFQPGDPYKYNERYTISLAAGIESTGGLPSWRGAEWTLDLSEPDLLYLKNESGQSRLWIKRVGSEPLPLTPADQDVWDYSVAPDGQGILLSVMKANKTADLMLFETGGDLEPLLTCAEHLCTSGRWQPGGSHIAFERRPPIGEDGPVSVWLLDTTTGQVSPLEEVAVLNEAGFQTRNSHSPRWSADGRYLAYFQPETRLIVVQEFIALSGNAAETFIPANLEQMGDWSPTDYRLAYTELAFGQQEPHEHVDANGTVISHTEPALYNHLVISDLTTGISSDLAEGQEVNDGPPAWRPDGQALAFGRTSTGSGRQIWLIPSNGAEPEQVTTDPFSQHTALSWSPDGQKLAFMRLSLAVEEQGPTIWLLQPETGAEELAADAGFLPGWLP